MKREGRRDLVNRVAEKERWKTIGEERGDELKGNEDWLVWREGIKQVLKRKGMRVEEWMKELRRDGRKKERKNECLSRNKWRKKKSTNKCTYLTKKN